MIPHHIVRLNRLIRDDREIVLAVVMAVVYFAATLGLSAWLATRGYYVPV